MEGIDITGDSGPGRKVAPTVVGVSYGVAGLCGLPFHRSWLTGLLS